MTLSETFAPRAVIFTSFLSLAFLLTSLQPNFAQPEIEVPHHAKAFFKKHSHKKDLPPAKEDLSPAVPKSKNNKVEPFEPKLARLAEILGALSYLEPLCGGKPSRDWEGERLVLIEAATKSNLEKAFITEAFNHGVSDYALSYRICTPNAHKIISQFIVEGIGLAQDVVSRYGSS